MPIISVFNNKGGVGKSTVTIGLAEFLSGHQGLRTLVIDLDSQASTSGALVGRRAIAEAISEHRTTVDLMAALKTPARSKVDVSQFVITRPAVDGPRFSLGQIDLLVPNKPRQVDFEEEAMGTKRSLTLMRDRLKHQLLEEYDYVLVDHPGNVDRRQKFSWNGLAMSDFVIIPILPTEMTIAATPDTLEILEQVRESSNDVRPAVLAIFKNQTDHRTQQAKVYSQFITEIAAQGDLPPIMEAFWPPCSPLQTMSDERMKFQSLKEKYGSYYDHVRKMTTEIVKRCDAFSFPQTGEEKRNGIATRFRNKLMDFLELS